MPGALHRPASPVFPDFERRDRLVVAACQVEVVGEPEERLLPDRIVPGAQETFERFRRPREIPLVLGDPRGEVPRPFRRSGESAPLGDLEELLARLREPPRLPLHPRLKEAGLGPERRRGVRQMLFQERGGRRGLPLLPVELGVLQDQREKFPGGRETVDRLFEERPRPFRFPGAGGRLGELRVEPRRQVPSREETVGTPLPKELEGEDPGLPRRIGREILQVQRRRFRRGTLLAGKERGDIPFLRLSSAPAHLPAGESERFARRGGHRCRGRPRRRLRGGDTGAGGSRRIFLRGSATTPPLPSASRRARRPCRGNTPRNPRGRTPREESRRRPSRASAYRSFCRRDHPSRNAASYSGAEEEAIAKFGHRARKARIHRRRSRFGNGISRRQLPGGRPS